MIRLVIIRIIHAEQALVPPSCYFAPASFVLSPALIGTSWTRAVPTNWSSGIRCAVLMPAIASDRLVDLPNDLTHYDTTISSELRVLARQSSQPQPARRRLTELENCAPQAESPAGWSAAAIPLRYKRRIDGVMRELLRVSRRPHTGPSLTLPIKHHSQSDLARQVGVARRKIGDRLAALPWMTCAAPSANKHSRLAPLWLLYIASGKSAADKGRPTLRQFQRAGSRKRLDEHVAALAEGASDQAASATGRCGARAETL
ncbi:MAG: hypothetical protein H6643_02155 [Caldilineaceae bacterium]|nr:hypothetical protein [Caldilineaceae bacterium]